MRFLVIGRRKKLLFIFYFFYFCIMILCANLLVGSTNLNMFDFFNYLTL